MSDADRLSILSGILDGSARLIRSMIDELRQYRAVDNEEKFLEELEDVTGRIIHG